MDSPGLVDYPDSVKTSRGRRGDSDIAGYLEGPVVKDVNPSRARFHSIQYLNWFYWQSADRDNTKLSLRVADRSEQTFHKRVPFARLAQCIHSAAVRRRKSPVSAGISIRTGRLITG